VGDDLPLGLAAAVEAALMCADRPLPAPRIAEVLASAGWRCPEKAEAPDAAEISRAIDELNREYDRTGRAFRAERVAGGVRLVVCAEHAAIAASMQRTRASTQLSRAAIETLAIIAYKQPIARADVEAIRGVASGEILKTLIDRRLVTITGRAEEPGRPMLYGTTREFLDAFGLSSVKDLPSIAELSPGGSD
jgi:segregation and condensation protein B